VSTATIDVTAPLSAAMARQARLQSCTLLLVDDEEANLDLLEAVLEQAGYTRLVRTQDAREVMALAAEHAPDLVLLDLHMPHRHGLEVLADLGKVTPADEYRPVLVLTADVTGQARDRALALGARDFVTKPFDTTEVLLRVENLLDARALHVDERRARERAQAAEARAALLAEWSRVLASSIDVSDAATHLRALVVPRWAAACDVLFGDNVPTVQGGMTSAVVNGDGVVGAIVLEGQGVLSADQPLVDELAARLGMAAEHARLLADAQRATRERERLLAVVAHDLRNPLGAVALYAEVLGSLQPDDGDPDSYTRHALASIHTSTATMQRLVEDLLDAATLRGGALRVHRADLRIGAVFEEAERILRPIADAAGVGLVVKPVGDAATETGPVDQQRVVQLLSNLVGNAIKFTPTNGDATVTYAVTAEGIEASVADTGSGIAPDDLPHLFTAFWRGDDCVQKSDGTRRGVGLGLWIAQAIVDAHGGTLRVESHVGVGTTFHFTLPFETVASRWED
jgi:signal transduction histidine kinase